MSFQGYLALVFLPIAFLISGAHAATIDVDDTSGAVLANSLCSISEAIQNANNDNAANTDCTAGLGADTISVGADIALTGVIDAVDGGNGTPSISSEIVIEGNGHTIERNDTIPCIKDDTVLTPSEFRIFHVGASGNLTLSDAVLKNGCTGNQGAGFSGIIGGAIYSAGRLLVEHSRFINNQAYYGGAIGFDEGSNGYNSLNHNTFSQNKAIAAGAILSLDTAAFKSVVRNTFVGNIADDFGGAVVNNTGAAQLSFYYNTFSGNSVINIAGVGSAIVNNGTIEEFYANTFANHASSGVNDGAIYNTDTATVGNFEYNIVTSTQGSGSDCFNAPGGVFTAGKDNRSDDGSCIGSLPGGGVTNFDGVLRDNGCAIESVSGCNKSHALLPGSNAIDGGPGHGGAPDHRGFHVYNYRDTGAFELQRVEPGQCPAPLAVDGFTTTVTNPFELQQAIYCSNYNGNQSADTINFGADIVLTGQSGASPSGIYQGAGKTGTPVINTNLVINGNGYKLNRNSLFGCTINNDYDTSEFRLLYGNSSSKLNIDNLRLENGCADTNLDPQTFGNRVQGGALLAYGETTIENSVISKSSANVGGGAYLQNEKMRIVNSTFSQNIASSDTHNDGEGGALFVDGYNTVNPGNPTNGDIINSTFSGNSAKWGGALYFSSANTLVQNSTLWGNAAITGIGGGGIGGAIRINMGDIQLNNSVVSNTLTGENCANKAVTSGTPGTLTGKNNLISDASCDGNLGDVSHIYPMLKDNGCAVGGPHGCVPTHALLEESNAINAGDNASCPASDGRGKNRLDGACDIGAFELLDDEFCFVVNAKGKKAIIFCL